MQQRTFYIKTFGCQMNERDSEIMAQSLVPYGYLEGMDMEQADLVILNTCSIRAKAEQKVMSLLGYLRKQKKNNPALKICVAGCVAQQEGSAIIRKFGHVDLVVGTQNIYSIGKLLQEAEEGGARAAIELKSAYDIPRFLPEPGHRPSLPSSPAPHGEIFSKFVTIMQGCNNFCTYCVVPYTRGRESSRKVKDIVDEVNVLVEAGVREITLLGQNVNSYGQTNQVTENGQAYRFSDLLREVAAIQGLKRLRCTTSNPKDLDDELIACFADLDKLCPQFHLPVQAGSDAVLKRMNRKYSVANYLDLVSKLRKVCPGIALTTDIIVGFPGESEQDFQGTMDLLNEVRYHGSFSFKYSDRPGTRASSYSDKIPEEIKTKRLARFQARQGEISLERNKEYLGQDREIMLEQVSVEGARGRTSTNHIVHLNEAVSGRPGDLIKVNIYHAGKHSLKGRVC